MDDPWGWASVKKSKKKKRASSSKQERLWAKFVSLPRISDALDVDSLTGSDAGAPTAGHLLSHAKVYVFAESFHVASCHETKHIYRLGNKNGVIVLE